MTGFLLDTNVPSELQRPRHASELDCWLETVEDEQLHLSMTLIAEVVYGIARLPESRRRTDLQHWLDSTLRPWFFGRILPITEFIAERLGVISAFRETQGRPIAFADGLIAATALEHNLTLVTRNTKHFGGLGLTLIDPWRYWVF